MKGCDSEIFVKQIRINQGVGVWHLMLRQSLAEVLTFIQAGRILHNIYKSSQIVGYPNPNTIS